MNKFNVKIGSSFALVAMVASVLLPVATQTFAALNDPEFDLALSWGYDAGLTSYNTEGAFMPMNTLTREQGARFLSQFASGVLGIEGDEMMDCNFTDAAMFDSTLSSYITMACEQGLLKGFNNRFMPTQPMTKAQFVTALVRGLDGMMPENVMPWYKNYCTWAQTNGITKETDCMALDRPITRYEALLMLYRGRVVGDDVVTDGTDGTGSTTTGDNTTVPGEDVTVTVGGEVAINISDNTPGVQYVPGTSTNVRALKFDVTAGDNGVEISSINFKLEGLVNRNNVKVAITDSEGVRLSTERNFNTNFEALVTANTSAGIKVPAKTTRSFYAVVSNSGSINERFTISIPGAASVSATATVGGSFPIVSNQINTTEYSSQTVKFDGQEVAQATGTINDRLYVGNTNKQVGQFRLSSTTSNSRDVTLKNIRLKSTDQVQNVLTNVKLMVNGVNVASGVVVDGKYVTFIINDYLLPYGSSKTFYIMADVIGGERNDNVQFFLDETTDIVGLENGTNASVAVAYESTPKRYLKAYTVEEGDNFISRTDGLTSNTNIPTDADKVLALKANVYVTSEISVDKMRVYYTGTATSGSIESVELYVNGLLVDEISPFIGGTPNYLEFAFFGNLKAGSNSIEVRIDTQRNAPNGEYIKFTLKNDALQGAEYVSTNNNVLPNDISGTADGVYLIIRQAAAETISKTFVANPQIAIREGDITAIKFAIKANNVRDLVVRGFNVNISGYNNANGGVQDATLYVAGTTGIQDVESFSKGTSISFNSLNITIPASTSKEFWVITKTTVDLPAGATAAPYDLQFFVNNFDIEDTEGNRTTATFSVAGNLIDVRSSLEVFGNRTSVEQSTIIPANGNTAINIGTFEIKSDYAEAIVEEITLVNLINNVTVVDSGTVAGNIDTSSDGAVVDLYQGTNLVGSAQLLDGAAYIDLSTPVSIPAGGTTVFTVKVKNSTIITSAGDTNKKIRLGVLSPGQLGNGSSTAQTLISAVGNSVSANGQFTSLVFNEQRLRATTLVLTDQPISDASVNNLLTVAGQNEAVIFRTILSADSSKSANLKQINFKFTQNGVAATGFKLKVDNTVLLGADATCTLGTGVVKCVFNNAYDNGLTIAAGGSRKIELVADVTASTLATDYISTSINEGAAQNFNMDTYANIAATAATIVWSDNAAPNVTPTTANWFTDAGLEKTPSNAWTFSRN